MIGISIIDGWLCCEWHDNRLPRPKYIGFSTRFYGFKQGVATLVFMVVLGLVGTVFVYADSDVPLERHIKLFEVYYSKHMAYYDAHSSHMDFTFNKLVSIKASLLSHRADSNDLDIRDKIDVIIKKIDAIQDQKQQTSTSNIGKTTSSAANKTPSLGSVRYHSTQGTVWGLDMEIDPSLTQSLGLVSHLKTTYADGALGNLTVDLDNKFQLNNLPMQANISTFFDQSDSQNNQAELSLNTSQRVRYFVIDDYAMNTAMRVLFTKNKTDTLQLNLGFNKNENDQSKSAGYLMNLSQTTPSGYHQLFYGQNHENMATVWNRDYGVNAQSRLTYYPSQPLSTLFYGSIQNRFKAKDDQLTSTVQLSYLPNNNANSYVSILNQYRINQPWWLFKYRQFNVDTKQSNTTGGGYTRLGSTQGFNIFLSDQAKCSGQSGIDYVSYQNATSSYYAVFGSVNYITSDPSSLASAVMAKLEKRTYPNNNNSGWYLTFSENGLMSLVLDDLSRTTSLSYIAYDAIRAGMSDSLMLNVQLINSRAKESRYPFDLQLNFTYNYYLHNHALDEWVSMVLVSRNF